MRNRELLAAGGAALVLLALLLAVGSRYDNDPYEPFAETRSGDVHAALWSLNAGPMRQTYPLPWLADDPDGQAVIGKLTAMLGEASLVSVSTEPRFPAFLQSVRLWFNNGGSLVVMPGWRCEYSYGGETCEVEGDEIVVSSPGSPLLVRMRSRDLQQWLLAGYQADATMGTHEQVQAALEGLAP
jgi:hypothetical protein